MNKKLFTQIKNEWRSNLWLVTELLLVSVVLWYIVDYMYVQTSIYNEQNEQAFRFYRNRGFEVISRDETDAQGKPFPILHMQLTNY